MLWLPAPCCLSRTWVGGLSLLPSRSKMCWLAFHKYDVGIPFNILEFLFVFVLLLAGVSHQKHLLWPFKKLNFPCHHLCFWISLWSGEIYRDPESEALKITGDLRIWWTWKHNLHYAIEAMNDIGVKFYSSFATLSRWHRKFACHRYDFCKVP